MPSQKRVRGQPGLYSEFQDSQGCIERDPVSEEEEGEEKNKVFLIYIMM